MISESLARKVIEVYLSLHFNCSLPLENIIAVHGKEAVLDVLKALKEKGDSYERNSEGSAGE